MPVVWFSKLMDSFSGDPRVHIVLSPPFTDYVQGRKISNLIDWIGYSVFVDNGGIVTSVVTNTATAYNINAALRDPTKRLVTFCLFLYYVGGGAHANFIVVNKNSQHIEHYDPWGGTKSREHPDRKNYRCYPCRPSSC